MPFDLFERIAEERIQEAMGRGEFENLAGMGEPLRGLEGYFATPEHLRVGYSMLKSSGFVPEEVSLRKEIELLRERVRAPSCRRSAPSLDARTRSRRRSISFRRLTSSGTKPELFSIE